jgi:diaminopimelate epimerase
MLLRFTKMHGLGNDFAVVDLISQSINLTPLQIRVLADRRLGVGFDQLLTVSPPMDPELDFFYRIYNADGTEAQQCGNGARCLLRFVRDRGLTTRTFIRLQTINGEISCKLERHGNVAVNMGQPIISPGDVPFEAAAPATHYDLALNVAPKDDACDATMPCGTVSIAAVSMGNPHAVLRVDDVDTAPVATLGPLIERHSRFPEGANVGFMQVIDRQHIRLRVFERGVGETLACGTGACAAVVAGRRAGDLDESVTVELAGGSLTVQWSGKPSACVHMTGPANQVYEGRTHI